MTFKKKLLNLLRVFNTPLNEEHILMALNWIVFAKHVLFHKAARENLEANHLDLAKMLFNMFSIKLFNYFNVQILKRYFKMLTNLNKTGW